MRVAFRPLLIICLTIAIACAINTNTLAYTGGGSGSDGWDANCESTRAYTGLCDGGASGGGASWHIYKTSGSGAYSGPKDDPLRGEDYAAAILTEAGGVGGIMKNCPPSLTNYYIAYGWDSTYYGWYPNTHFGPAKREGGDIISDAEYNNYNALGYDQIVSAIANNTLSSGQRITAWAANHIYELENNGNSIPNYAGYFCAALQATLTGVAVDKNGNSVPGLSDVTSTVPSGKSAKVTRREKADWTFLGWRTNKTSGSPSGGADYTVDNLRSNQTVYAVYEYKSFQAEAKSGSKNTTGYTNDSKTAKRVFTCNNLTDGCNITFTLNMKRIAGSGESKYSILEKKVSSSKFETKESNKSFNPTEKNGTAKLIKEYTVAIKPGQSACYRLTFHPYGDYDANTTKSVTICAYAISNLGSSITMMVKKNNSAKFNHAPDTKPLYVKPTDTVYLQGSYTPKAQYAANLSSKRLVINKITDETSGKIISRFNKLIEPDWKNAFSIRLKNANNKVIVGGDTKKKNGVFSNYTIDRNSKITKDYVGQTLTAVAQTNISKDYKTTPKSANITYVDGTGFVVNINNSVASDSDYIKVPYNFSNRTEITDNPDEKIVYAGQDATINYSTIVGTRKNNTIGGNAYATIVRNAKYKMRMTSDGGSNWTYSEEENGTLHNNDSLESETISREARFIIPDVSAGSKICFQSLVYPKDSGNDTNLNSKYYDENNLNNWAFSGEKCFVVAKRPSLQVWGGNIYSSGEIDTSIAAKTINGNLHTFGSWGELGIISGGAVKGMASGASYGYSGPNFAANPGGAKGSDFCEASPLSFANNDCQNGETGSLNISFGRLSNDSDFITQALANENANITRYSDLSEFSGEIDSGTVFISNPDDDININKDIKYTGNYTSLDSMPKVIIYAENVNIFCNVSRIDALIIAKETVKTCSNGGDINSKDRSNQLIINGAIIAKKLEADRTYGAGAGNYSIIPAEIINFDPSLYLWGGKEVNVDANTSLKNSYVRELSPRY